MLDDFKRDWVRYKKKDWEPISILQVLRNQYLRYMLIGRLSVSCKNKYIKKMLGGGAKWLGQHMGNELNFNKIGTGLVLLHPYSITVNPNAELGNDVTLFKGCTVGSIRSGKKQGVPCIGDRVTICSNAMVCGNIHIGNDVLIAAGAFVNFNVPDNSLVIGNPGKVYPKECASQDYL